MSKRKKMCHSGDTYSLIPRGKTYTPFVKIRDVSSPGLSDMAIAVLEDGKLNSRLISELLSHADFSQFSDEEIVVLMKGSSGRRGLRG